MEVYETVVDMRRNRRQATGTVSFVPTMGALHQGHVALIRRARELGERLVVSIFVNPTQFAPGEDYEQYPRMVDHDLAACRDAGVDAVFAPSVDDMYPPEVADAYVDVPGLSSDLEGAYRPGHFAGVCRVVAKLLNIVHPHVACFGQKDYQQYKVVQAMAADMAMPTAIEAVPTVREADGLALSSRNKYLTEQQRPQALGLYKALCQARELIEQEGETDPAAVEKAMHATLTAHHLQVDYAVVRHRQTLAKLDIVEPAVSHGVVAMVAARLGKVRLIDNMLLGLGGNRD